MTYHVIKQIELIQRAEREARQNLAAKDEMDRPTVVGALASRVVAGMTNFLSRNLAPRPAAIPTQPRVSLQQPITVATLQSRED